MHVLSSINYRFCGLVEKRSFEACNFNSLDKLAVILVASY